MKMQRVDTYGSAWQHAGACPAIYGLVQRDVSTVTGVRVGVTATSASRQFNAYDVTADPDSITVTRLFGEKFFDGLADSLVQRTAQLHGTSRAWMLVYAD